jgi:hypothetical protein
MTDHTNKENEPEARGFPYITVGATLAVLFAFLGLMVLAYQSPNYLDEAKPDGEPKADAATRLNEVRAKNQAILDGTGSKMSAAAATAELLDRVKKDGKLPFPMPEPAAPPPAEPKKN